MDNAQQHRHKERVEAVLDVMKEIARQEYEKELDKLRDKLQAMSYEELGELVVEIVKTRSLDRVLA